MRGALTMSVWLALAACGEDGPSEYETAAPLFEPGRVLQVDVSILPSDWDILRAQTRTWDDLFTGADCLAAPFPSPFTYFPAQVTIDGELLADVAVRKKGFIGSMSDTKPSLKISVDHFDPDVTFHGLEKITLNNSIQDPAYLSTCLAYSVFDRAGVPAPRCNFAQVSVNGQPLGLYVHVEGIEDELLDHHFGSSGGNLYEGTLSDFDATWSGTFDKKNNLEQADWSDVDAVISAAQVPDAELLPALEAVIDLDEFFTFWAVESLIRHWDGYAGNINNYWLYRSDGRLHFLPWGADQVLVDRNPIQGDDAPTSVYATGVLARRLYLHPDGRARYVAALRALLDGPWDEALILAEMDRMEALITPLAVEAELAPALAVRREFVANRRAQLQAELDAGPPEWTYPVRPPFCQSGVTGEARRDPRLLPTEKTTVE